MVGKTALGKYRLLRSLGTGSNGEAFLAVPVRFPEYRVVVKVIHPHVVTNPKFRQLFEAEVQSMSNFDHPYTVGLVEASADDPLGPCLVMEYAPGVTLETVISLDKRLGLERTGRLLGCLCHALQAAHAAGIYHRDLKPANLMVVKPGTPDESVKVMDFGFAGFAAKPHIQLAELTGHGPIYAIGTPAYVSPEMIRGDRVDGRSDLYSVGVILYEMLTGRLPFTHTVQNKLLAAHIQDPPPAFRKIGCRDIPPGVEAAVQLALAKYPIERQQTAKELADTYGRALGLDIWAESAPVGWEPAPQPTPIAVLEPEPELDAVAMRRPSDPFYVLEEFDAFMPERLAAAKLRGFVEDCKGEVLASEPGLIRMRIGMPPATPKQQPGSSLFGWFRATRPTATVQRGQEPIEVELHLDKPDPSQPRLHVLVAFRPVAEFPPNDAENWSERCEVLHTVLRQYLGA